MVVYIVGFPHGWCKVGFAACIHERFERGFWGNLHPPELCCRLADAQLLHLFAGDMATELAMHAALGADAGEFYSPGRLPQVLGLLSLALEPLPLPDRLPVASTRGVDKRGDCNCGGDHRGFTQDKHMRRSYATRGRSAPCELCGKMVSIRRDKLKQHQRSSACKSA